MNEVTWLTGEGRLPEAALVCPACDSSHTELFADGSQLRQCNECSAVWSSGGMVLRPDPETLATLRRHHVTLIEMNRTTADDRAGFWRAILLILFIYAAAGLAAFLWWRFH